MTRHEALHALDMTKKSDNFATIKTHDKSTEINLNGALMPSGDLSMAIWKFARLTEFYITRSHHQTCKSYPLSE